MDSQRIDYSAAVDGSTILPRIMLRHIKGIRGTRTVPVSRKQIYNWFRGTPEAFVQAALDSLLDAGTVRIYAKSLGTYRRYDGAYARRVRLNIHDEGFELVLSDMLADLAHFCDTEGVEIDECLARAEDHYGNESPRGTQSFHANHHTSTDPH